MKYFLSLFVAQLIALQLCAAGLVLVPTQNYNETKRLFQNSALTIHFYCNDFVIASLDGNLKENYVLLDNDPWTNSNSYYLVYVDEYTDKSNYISTIADKSKILFQDQNKLIVKINEQLKGQLTPAKNDGMVRIFNSKAKLPMPFFESKFDITQEDPFVLELLSEISGTNLTSIVQHMQDYGTRNSYHAQSIVAQNWIKDTLEAMGLSVEIMDFTMPSGPASDNVIATKVGTKYPNEIVVLGGHYDTISNTNEQPGADDNASGTAAVIEIARILSEHEFDRTIIFCAFSGEEYGLYGSAAYASRCAQQGMNILGYFNLDMVGYLKPFNTIIKSSIIYPQSAQELGDFYTAVSNLYLPNFLVVPGTLIGGSSDHASFNNSGFMGIYPFEDLDNYSPYIHTPNDIVGLSYNAENQAVVFTKATLASVVTMANYRYPPKNLAAVPCDNAVELIWDSMVDVSWYKIYKNGTLYDSIQTNYYADFAVENGTSYQYYISCLFSDTNKESAPSKTVSVIPSIPMELPLLVDFEGDLPHWDFAGSWGLSATQSYSPTHSLTESPMGNYGNNQNVSATFGPVSLIGYSTAQLSFWTKYDLESNYDHVYVEVSSNNQNWTALDQFSGLQSAWTDKSYVLNSYLNSAIYIRFRFTSDGSVTNDGINIDDFEISVTGDASIQPVRVYAGWSGISSYLLPFQSQMSEVLQPISNNLIIVQDETDSYYPSQSVNTVGSWNAEKGYKIKVANNSYLRIAGSSIENQTINISAGWNILPIVSSCPVECSALFSQTSEITIVKEIGNVNVYWPAKEVETLEYLQPGKAYYVYATGNTTVTFPNCEEKQYAYTSKKDTDSPWEMTPPTGNSHVISISKTALQNFSVGDKIGAFISDGKCAGMVTIENFESNIALVAFENDTLTSVVDGFQLNETLVFKLYKSSTGETENLAATYNMAMPQNSAFHPKGLSSITQLVVGNTGIEGSLSGTRIYPNPAKESVFIELPHDNQVTLEVVNLTGQILETRTVTGSSTVNTALLPKGMYFFRILDAGFRTTHKIVIQ
ncbi:MAG: M28 family peptidase [Salinivirgaceae bacterium]|nr:M28 family peptidase [Salinivirgaceae bacterium]